MARFRLSDEIISLVAERFRALSEPARLQLLNALRDGERSVTELMEETGLGQANVSKHLRVLHGLGFVERRKEGLYVYYRLADECVFELCDIVCGRLALETRARSRALNRR
jgi:DNA-binding transcriptional ArsR family regulator